MMLTRRHLSRRAVLKGMGVTVALPFLDAMLPATASAQAGRKRSEEHTSELQSH